MKAQLTLALVVLAVLACSARAAEEEAWKKDVLGVKDKCLADLNGTEADLKEMEEKHEVTTEFAKKMTLCVFRAYKFIDDKNKFSKDSVVEAAKKVLDGKPNQADVLKNVQEIAEACDKEVGTAERPAEETAKSVFDCFKKNMIERKLGDAWKI